MNPVRCNRRRINGSLWVLPAVVVGCTALLLAVSGCDPVSGSALGPTPSTAGPATGTQTNTGSQTNSGSQSQGTTSNTGTSGNTSSSGNGGSGGNSGSGSSSSGGSTGSGGGAVDSEPENPWGDNVNLVAVAADGTAELEGDLADGAPLADLTWADDSNVACFTSPQFSFFKGNQVFYALESPQPAHSIVRISAIPDSTVEVSLYGYTSSITSHPLPPMHYSTTCESSLGSTITGPNPGVTESIEFHNPTGNEYNIFFAVSGDAYTGTAGHYEVIVELIDAY